MSNLGVFLAIGESLSDFKKKGQLARLLDYNIRYYSKDFEKIFIFSYANEHFKLPSNVVLIHNRFHLHRYLYCVLLPLIEFNSITKCHTFRGLQLSGGIPAFVCKLLFRKPYIVNYGYDYSSFARIEKKYWQSLFYQFIKYPILKMANIVLITSNEFKRDLANLNISNLMYIPNGVDLRLFKPFKSKQILSYANIVFAGRLEDQKNLEELVVACSQLKVPYSLNFYGEGSKKFLLESLARKLKVPLKIHKPVEYKLLPKILSAADVFVLVSKEEGNPKILIEAAACGCLIVASSVQGINDIFENGVNAILCGTDHLSISKALAEALNRGNGNLIKKNARLMAESKFDIDRLLKQESTVLRGICL